MRKLTLRLTVSLLTFAFGVAAVAVWLIDRQSSRQETRPATFKERMESSFFRQLDEHAKGMNLSQLRTATLPDNDLEVRLWYDALPYRLEGVILRRSAGRWSAVHLRESEEGQPAGMQDEILRAPKSGWEMAWSRLVGAGILTLPDASEVRCHSEALDGVGYLVETNINKTYRTYRYGNPQFMSCSEARLMVKLVEIMEEEFDMWNPDN